MDRFMPALLLQESYDSMLHFLAGGVFMLIWLGLVIVLIAGWWKIFTKAGEPGWMALIPILNILIILTKIAGRPAWWILLMFIPVVNVIVYVIVAIDVAKAFGQGVVFALILLVLLGGIGYVVLGWGNYQFRGPANPVA